MKFTVAVLALAGTMVVGAFGALGTAQGKSQWEGVFTAEQAKRGEGLVRAILRQLPRP